MCPIFTHMRMFDKPAPRPHTGDVGLTSWRNCDEGEQMSTLLTIPEAAPLLRKNEGAARMWLRSRDCPIKVVRIGRRVYVRQEDIHALIDGADRSLQEAG